MLGVPTSVPMGGTVVAWGGAVWTGMRNLPPPTLGPNAVVNANSPAGATFPGEFEQRMNGVLKEIAELPKQPPAPLTPGGPDVPPPTSCILFIDDMHTITGPNAGQVRRGRGRGGCTTRREGIRGPRGAVAVTGRHGGKSMGTNLQHAVRAQGGDAAGRRCACGAACCCSLRACLRAQAAHALRTVHRPRPTCMHACMRPGPPPPPRPPPPPPH